MVFFLPSLLFVAFYSYALFVCVQKKTIQPQPATYAQYVFSVLLALLLLHLIGSLPGIGRALYPFLRTFGAAHLALFAVLIGLSLGGRPQPDPFRQTLWIWLSIAIGLRAAGFAVPLFMKNSAMNRSLADIQSTFLLLNVLTAILNLSAFGIVLKCLFSGRGYPERARTASQPPADSASPSLTQRPPFPQDDFVPYLIGVMVLAGFLIIPVLWGSFMGIPYTQALFSSVLSCILFCISHNKQGQFQWAKFVMLYLFAFFSILRSTLEHGYARPMFLAGGFLGMMVMFGCGWAGIGIARWMRKQFPRS